MELLGKLGINFTLLIAQIINFILLMWILKKLLYSHLIDMIHKEDLKLSSIQDEMETLSQRKKELSEINSKQHSKAIEIIDEANEIADEIVQKARAQSLQEKKSVSEQLAKYIKNVDDEKKAK